MTAAQRDPPSFLSLYRSDLTLRKSANAAAFGIVAAGGFYWVSRPMPNLPADIDHSFDTALAQCGAIGGIIVCCIALLILLRRWRKLRRILAEGEIINGLVEDIDVAKWSSSRDSTTRRSRTRYSYAAIIRYTILFEERTIRIRLPNSGFTFGLTKGQEAELIVHEWLPNEPLIRAVYYPHNLR